MNDASNNLKGVIAELEEYKTTVILGGVCYVMEVSEAYVVQEIYRTATVLCILQVSQYHSFPHTLVVLLKSLSFCIYHLVFLYTAEMEI